MARLRRDETDVPRDSGYGGNAPVTEILETFLSSERDAELLLPFRRAYSMQMATRKPRTRPWTRADLARLPDDGNRYEVLDGELFVTPQAAFGHQSVALRLTLALKAYCDRHQIGVVVGPGAVIFGKNELQPDVQVIPGVGHSEDAKWEQLPPPILVVEVLSTSTAWRDRGKKRDAYLRINTPEYWIVDRHKKTVEVSRPGAPDPILVSDVLRWLPSTGGPELTINLKEIFV